MEDEEKNLAKPPHGALFLVLAYLPLFELLSMSQICKSMKDRINGDILQWLKSIIIGDPLNSRLTDDALLNITSKANGRLTTLTLFGCINISDHGLLTVIARNPLINKLHIPNCTSLTPEGVIEAVKTLYQQNGSLKSLKILGIPNINKEHYETLLALLQVDQEQDNHPKLYHEYKAQLSPRGEYINEHQILDIEICPRCRRGEMVFNCPRVTCNRRRGISMFNRWRTCKGCYRCIHRCEDCGNCMTFSETCGAACGDILCNICWITLPKCSICNKAYCNQHRDLQCSLTSLSSSEFVCHICHENSLNSSDL